MIELDFLLQQARLTRPSVGVGSPFSNYWRKWGLERVPDKEGSVKNWWYPEGKPQAISSVARVRAESQSTLVKFLLPWGFFTRLFGEGGRTFSSVC